MSPLHFLPLLISLLPIPVLTNSMTPRATPTTCNGNPAYCTRLYSNITFLGAHDSPFVGPLPQQNQNLEVTEQLDLGIRFLQGQTHKSLDESDTALRLCHTSCLLEDAGTLQSFLETVKGWLDAHPDEVITLLLTNGDSVPVARFDEAFAGAGLRDYVFVPEGSPKALTMDAWPTLAALIEKGKRLVVFLGEYQPSVKGMSEGYVRLTMDRLRRRCQLRPLYPQRVHLLLRNPLRRNRRELPELQHRPSVRCVG
jgi:hypothetical protein